MKKKTNRKIIGTALVLLFAGYLYFSSDNTKKDPGKEDFDPNDLIIPPKPDDGKEDTKKREEPKPLPIPGSTEERDRYDGLYQDYGKLYGIDWKILKALAGQETNFGMASHYKNKIPRRLGLIPLKEVEFNWVRDKLGSEVNDFSEMWEPEKNVRFAAKLLSFYYNYVGKDLNKFLAYYKNGDSEKAKAGNWDFATWEYINRYKVIYAGVV
ncbi:MAG: transglycosylase SLT domain-containing protein [Leptospiraceae bacterium]|nr:transglycosylase SLT domain-containing protein [Leptospiraceae bacterium]